MLQVYLKNKVLKTLWYLLNKLSMYSMSLASISSGGYSSSYGLLYLNFYQKPSYFNSAYWAKPLSKLVFSSSFFTNNFLIVSSRSFFSYSFLLYYSYFFLFSITSSNYFFRCWGPPYLDDVSGMTVAEFVIFLLAIDSYKETNDFLTLKS